MEIISAATLLFLVMDPLGNIPIFLSVLDDVAPERRTRVLVRELILQLKRGYLDGAYFRNKFDVDIFQQWQDVWRAHAEDGMLTLADDRVTLSVLSDPVRFVIE